MEENLAMEQPDANASNVNEQIIKNEEGSNDAGSILGKFKDTTSLEKAYSSLQKEFTRKSQKLAELSKLLGDQKTQNSQGTNEICVQNDQNEQINNTKEQRPLFLSSSWRKNVSDFFEQNPDAKPFAKEISNILIGDKNLAALDNCLGYAFGLAKLASKPVDINNPSTIDLLTKNENIQNAVINNYLRSLSEGKSNLRFISGEPTMLSLTPTQDKPRTIKDASNILKKLLQS